MRRRVKLLFVTGLLAACMMLIAACGGKKFDASGYVKSFMDMLTKGEVEEYMEFTGQSKDEAMEDYNAMTNAMMETVAKSGVSKETQERFKDVYVKILAKSKYTVKDAVEKDNDGYSVDVVIEPITGLYDGLTEELQTEVTEYATQLVQSGKEYDQDELNEYAFTLMLDKMEERIDNLSYGEPQTITVEIEKEDGTYKIDDEEEVGAEIGRTLIDTSSLQ